MRSREPLMEPDPAELVAGAARGDQAAWDGLVRRYAPMVFHVIRAHGLSGADAADVSQTVWLRLVESLGSLRQPGAVAAWLATTTRRECYRQARAGRRTRPFDPTAPVDGHCSGVPASLLTDPTTPDEGLLRAERRQALRDGLAQLPDRCRELLVMLVADPPASYREISAQLQIPVGSIGPTQARCLRKLRSCPAIVAFVDALRAAEGGKEERGAVSTTR